MGRKLTDNELMVQFYRRVKRTYNCWLWDGGNIKGRKYGQLYRNGKGMLAHRYSFLIHNGPIPDGMCVLHSCDNPPCVNPGHLWLGTYTDNARDKIAKGRNVPPRGIRNGLAKLTPLAVKEIRSRYAIGGITQTELGRQYGVVNGHISKVISGSIWSHV